MEYRVIVGNLKDDGVVHVDHVGHCLGGGNSEDDDSIHVDHVEILSVPSCTRNAFQFCIRP